MQVQSMTQSNHSRSARQLVRWQIRPDGDLWTLCIEGRGQLLATACARSRSAARALVVHAREVFLGRAPSVVPPALDWGREAEDGLTAQREVRARKVTFHLRELHLSGQSIQPFRYWWRLEVLGEPVMAEGLATSFMQAEQLAAASAEALVPPTMRSDQQQLG